MPSLEAIVASLIGDDLQTDMDVFARVAEQRPLYYPLTTTLNTPNMQHAGGFSLEFSWQA